MASADIASTIASIIASFGNAREVLKRVCASLKLEKNAKKLGAATANARKRLLKSLRLGPKEIKHEYSRGLTAHGKRFKVGDGLAQTSLATTLLKLNSGLVDIISRFLKGGQTRIHPDYVSLAALSDSSRMETKQSLGALRQRLGHAASPMEGKSSRMPATTRKAPIGKTKAQVRMKQPKKSGSWALVRSKPSAQKLQSSSTPNLLGSGAAPKQPGKKTNPATTTPPALALQSPPISPLDLSQDRPRPKAKVPRKPVEPTHLRSTSAPSTVPIPTHTHPSNDAIPPPRPPKIPLQQPRPPIRKPRMPRMPIPSFYSTTTSSTKLGEIPMHKWSAPFDFDEMSRVNAEAAAEAGSFLPAKKPGKGLLGRMFKRKTREIPK
ncbi:MAG: hypothetical protein M1828_003782 [Chrysothrix sp. TS-e1954]|nr:MAG: hypothetical protein M1828_003782 [Chrysothrix sp. TS-e1954]